MLMVRLMGYLLCLSSHMFPFVRHLCKKMEDWEVSLKSDGYQADFSITPSIF